MEEEAKKTTREDLEQYVIDQLAEGLEPDVVRPATDLLKVLQEGRVSEVKAENEKLRIEMEEAKSVREAETARMRAQLEAESADKRSKNELIGNGIKAGAQFGGALFAGFVYGHLSKKIIGNEKADILTPNSKAWQILSKLRIG